MITDAHYFFMIIALFFQRLHQKIARPYTFETHYITNSFNFDLTNVFILRYKVLPLRRLLSC